jgi:glycosyltransferase involved in cell wall biosynthesis
MISIIMSTFNRSDTYLPNAIQSVINQDYKDWELIIVDDHSTDNTATVVDKFKSTDPRIHYHKTPIHYGSDPAPKNLGEYFAKGEYLMFLDDDNTLKFYALRILLDNIKNYDAVYGDMWIKPLEEKGISHYWDVQFLMLRNYIDTSECLMKRKAFKYVGGFDESLKKFIDWNLWVRMAKAGFRFLHVPIYVLNYNLHDEQKSQRIQTETYMHPKLGKLFTPTFDPTGCYIKQRQRKEWPRVAVFTLHYDRLDYSKKTWKEMNESAGYPFKWFAWNNGDEKGTNEWMIDKVDVPVEWFNEWENTPRNLGITVASNKLIGYIMQKDFDIIIKIDNDVEFITKNWLKDLVDLWKRNHMIYASPYVEGLLNNPGGAPRVGMGVIGDEYIEVTKHIGGIFAMISSKAYENFRWKDTFLHGNQDMEASQAFRELGYMPFYYPKHIICHRDTTAGQHKKNKKYFERRIHEKITQG